VFQQYRLKPNVRELARAEYEAVARNFRERSGAHRFRLDDRLAQAYHQFEGEAASSNGGKDG
jgi:hypothetical protein